MNILEAITGIAVYAGSALFMLGCLVGLGYVELEPHIHHERGK